MSPTEQVVKRALRRVALAKDLADRRLKRAEGSAGDAAFIASLRPGAACEVTAARGSRRRSLWPSALVAAQVSCVDR